MRNFALDAAPMLNTIDVPYRGIIEVRILWGEKHLFSKFKLLSIPWEKVLSFKYESEQKGFLNTHVTITCEGPKDHVILWTANFATINDMKIKRYENV